MPAYKVNAGMQHSRLQWFPFGIPQLSMLRIAPPIMTYFSKFFKIVMQDNGRSRWDTPGDIPRKWQQTDISGKPWFMLDMLSASKQA